jgi:hypothetical protein
MPFPSASLRVNWLRVSGIPATSLSSMNILSVVASESSREATWQGTPCTHNKLLLN